MQFARAQNGNKELKASKKQLARLPAKCKAFLGTFASLLVIMFSLLQWQEAEKFTKEA